MIWMGKSVYDEDLDGYTRKYRIWAWCSTILAALLLVALIACLCDGCVRPCN